MIRRKYNSGAYLKKYGKVKTYYPEYSILDEYNFNYLFRFLDKNLNKDWDKIYDEFRSKTKVVFHHLIWYFVSDGVDSRSGKKYKIENGVLRSIDYEEIELPDYFLDELESEKWLVSYLKFYKKQYTDFHNIRYLDLHFKENNTHLNLAVYNEKDYIYLYGENLNEYIEFERRIKKEEFFSYLKLAKDLLTKEEYLDKKFRVSGLFRPHGSVSRKID
jgi:hypothetical protein